MERRIKLRIRNLQLGSGPPNATRLASGLSRAISGALAAEKPGLANSVSQATAREVVTSLSSRGPAGTRR